MNFSAIPAAAVPDFWPEIEPGLVNLLENYTLGQYKSAGVLENLMSGEWQLFIVSDEAKIIACLVCNIAQGHKKTFEIGLCWGTSANAWSGEVLSAFEQIATEMGCDNLALDGRPGWRNIMRENGYKLKSVRYARQING